MIEAAALVVVSYTRATAPTVLSEAVGMFVVKVLDQTEVAEGSSYTLNVATVAALFNMISKVYHVLVTPTKSSAGVVVVVIVELLDVSAISLNPVAVPVSSKNTPSAGGAEDTES
jgi:hypothetical protein